MNPLYLHGIPLAVGISLCCPAVMAEVEYPDKKLPGKAYYAIEKDIYSLENNLLKVSWKHEGNRLIPLGIINKAHNTKVAEDLEAPELFLLSTDDNGTFNITPAQFRMVERPTFCTLKEDPFASRFAQRFDGIAFTSSFLDEETGIRICWYAELRNNSSYVKETYTICAEKPLNLKKVQLVDIRSPLMAVKGSVPGSPLVSEREGIYAGIELPVAQADFLLTSGKIGFECNLPMPEGTTQVFTTVLGVFPKNQLRRAFLYYLERERAAPYRQYLHYNGWYDDGLNPTEESLLKTAEAFEKEFSDRHLRLDGFVLDDGWDDVNEDLWMPSTSKFPNGFEPVVKAVSDIPASFGIWISPLGGYFGPEKRIEQAKKKGVLPQDASEFDLSRPEYYKWFKDRCSSLMKNDKVNYFKWDKAGDGVSPHFMALLNVADELREENSLLFVNTTVGTWPSPFWLNHIDCTWRNGTPDVDWKGKGNDREQWITFRDGACYNVVVKQGPLYPLNSIMHHGLVLGKEFQAKRVTFGADGTQKNTDLKNDARMYFASGTNCQELYLTPSLMDKKAWDDIVDAARWARRFHNVLSDVHWVGGDPNNLDIYGYAAWSMQGATLALRNPDDIPKQIELEAGKVFELPPNARSTYILRSPYADQRIKELKLEKGKPVQLELQPFEVLIFDCR